MKKIFCLIVILSVWCVANVGAIEIKTYGGLLPPFCGLKDGKPFGIAVDILTAVTKEGGPTFIYDFSIPWARAQWRIKDEFDSLILPLSRTSQRETSYQWIAELYAYQARFISIGRAAPINSLEEAKRLRIGTINGSASQSKLQKLGYHVEAVVEDKMNAKKLSIGRIDAWLVPEYAAKYAFRQLGEDPSKLQVGIPFGDMRTHYIVGNLSFPADQAKLIDDIVKKLRDRGEIDRILANYR